MLINTVTPKEVGFRYNIDFRSNTQANIESEGWTFTRRASSSWSFDSSGCKLTTSGQLMIRKTIDLTKYNKIHMAGTCYLKNNGGTWDGGVGLMLLPNGQDMMDTTQKVESKANRNVGTSTSNRGYMLYFNGNWSTTGTALSGGEYEWYLDLDLETGAVSGGMNNGLSLSGTLTSTYKGYIQQNNIEFGVMLDGKDHYIHTFSAEFV